MSKKFWFLGPLGTILNMVPVIMKLLRQDTADQLKADIANTIDGIKHENVELTTTQIKLMKQLQAQNELLEAELKRTIKYLNYTLILAASAFIIAVVCFVFIINQ